VICLERCFEFPASPPSAFLRWLLKHPGKLEWPGKRKERPRTYGKATQDLREDLVAGGARRQAAQEKGLLSSH
jgi:hypothetical protein